MRVIYILWLRQIKRYIRSRARIIGSLAQPLLFFLALGFGFGTIYQKAGGGSYIEFLGPGIIAMSIIFTSIFGGIELIWDKQFGFLKETLVAPVPRFTIMLGRTLGGATVAVAQGILVFLLIVAFGFRPASWALFPVALVFMFLCAVLFTAFGTAIASFLDDMQAFPIIMNFLVMPMFFLSGALFPLNGLSGTFKFVATIDPLSYGVDALRVTLVGAGHFGLLTDFTILVGVMFLFLGIGSFVFSRIEI